MITLYKIHWTGDPPNKYGWICHYCTKIIRHYFSERELKILWSEELREAEKCPSCGRRKIR